MEEIHTEDAPAPIGPYSQAVRDGSTVYVSGQGSADPKSREVEIEGVLAAAWGSLEDVVKATVYLRDMADYECMNEVYAERFSPPYPARAAVEVADLPIDVTVEISFVASV